MRGPVSYTHLAVYKRQLYGDVLPEHYGNSFANPDCAAERLGAELGQLLAFLYTEIRGDIAFAFEMRLEEITILNETFIDVCNLFEMCIRDRACPGRT